METVDRMANWTRFSVFLFIVALALGAAVLLGTSGCSMSQEAQATADMIKAAESDHSGFTNYIIHVPKHGCPPGWTHITSVFHAADGTTEDGCEKYGGGNTGAVDVLRPGESVTL